MSVFDFSSLKKHSKQLFLDLFHKKSFFAKNYLAYMLLILGSFFLMGTIFISQVAIYSLDEKNASLTYALDRATEITEIISASDSSNHSTIKQIYIVNMKQIAEEFDSMLLVSDLKGNIIFYYDSNNPDIQKTSIDRFIINQTIYSNSYSEIGNLYGFFDEITYVNTAISNNNLGEPESIVLIGMPSNSVSKLIYDLWEIFIIISTILGILILILTYFIASNITMPIKNIANASKQFATGDFSLRVPEDTNCIEIDDLSKSINNMASSLSVAESHRTTFIANVSHELKTPMTTIAGFIDGILDGTIPEESQSYYLNIVSEEVKRLSRLTIRMLKTSKVQDDNFTISEASFNFTETISKIIISFENKILEKNLNIQVDLPSEDVLAFGDRDNIYQVVYNLVENAVKFTNKDKLLLIHIKITDGFVRFSISNEGDTISPEKLEFLFDRFYKVDSSRTEDITGAGLGLYLVKKILALHKSSIDVTSIDGLTTFAFSLPEYNSKK